MWNPLYDRITAASESGNRDFDRYGHPIRSPAGALYKMQTMPATARDPGFGVRPAQSNSPEEYNRVGRDYRDAMFRRYDNDPAKGWAAYNWGPGNLDKALNTYGSDWLAHAPAETRAYVQKNVGQLGGQMPARKPTPMTLASFGPNQGRAAVGEWTLGDILGPDNPYGIPSLNNGSTNDLPSTLNGMTLADVTQNTGLPHAKPKAFGKGGKGWAALGIIGDALQTMRGGKATYMPFVQAEAQDMRQQEFDRQKWAQELAYKREEALRKAQEPPQWLQDAQTYASLPDEQKAMVTGYRDAMYPVLGDYQDAEGNTRQGVYSRSTHGFVQGADERTINGKTYRRVNGEWYEVGQ